MALECYRSALCRLLLKKDDMRQDLVKIDADEVQASRRGEIKQFLDDPVYPLDLFEYNPCTFSQFVIFCKLHIQKLCRPPYPAKRVLDLMRKPGGQCPER